MEEGAGEGPTEAGEECGECCGGGGDLGMAGVVVPERGADEMVWEWAGEMGEGGADVEKGVWGEEEVVFEEEEVGYGRGGEGFGEDEVVMLGDADAGVFGGGIGGMTPD